MKIGTRIYYTGDTANQEGFGTLVEVGHSAFLGGDAKVTLDDGRDFWVALSDIGVKYEGHCGTRFVTIDAYGAWRTSRSNTTAIDQATQKAIADGNEELAAWLTISSAVLRNTKGGHTCSQ